MKTVARSMLMMLAVMLCAMLPANAAPRNVKKGAKQTKQILVYTHRKNSNIEYIVDGKHFAGKELDYLLGELHVDAAKDSEVVVVLEDNMMLSDVKEVPSMAMKAGFTDVRAFVYWKGTGNMAEVLFGPVIKVKKNQPVD